jgi:TolA-binding protein
LSIASSLTPDTPANLAHALSLYQAAERNWNSGEWAKAEAAYREFLRQYPNYWLTAPAHVNLGVQLSFLKDGKEAAEQFTEAIKRAPGTRTAQRAKLGMAALYYAWGEYAKARDLFREVLTESKDWDLTKYATRQLKAVNLRLKDNAASSQK